MTVQKDRRNMNSYWHSNAQMPASAFFLYEKNIPLSV